MKHSQYLIFLVLLLAAIGLRLFGVKEEVVKPEKTSVIQAPKPKKIVVKPSKKKPALDGKALQKKEEVKTGESKEERKTPRKAQRRSYGYHDSWGGYREALSNAGINPEDFNGWFDEGVPKSIHYRKNGRFFKITGDSEKGTGKGREKTLNISDESSVFEVLEDRSSRFEENANHPSNVPEEKEKTLQKMDKKSFKLVGFKPGVRDDGVTRIAVPLSLPFSLEGPDHTFENVRGPELEKLRERTISLGHGGEITFEVKDGGWVINKSGPDFVIYENPFRFGPGGKYIYQEFAQVGVAEEDKTQSYKWFPCLPDDGIIDGCAGVVPTDEGGDQFDLSTLRIEKIRFIKIKDTNLNFNNHGENTEGFDLDSLDLINAYKEKEKK